VSTTHYRLDPRGLALLALLAGSLLSTACSQSAETSEETRRPFGTGVMTREEVERSMALHGHPGAPAPSAPVEAAPAAAVSAAPVTPPAPQPVAARPPQAAVSAAASAPKKTTTARATTTPTPPAPVVPAATAAPAVSVAAPSIAAVETSAPAAPPATMPVEAPVALAAPMARPAVYVHEPTRIYSKDDPDVIPAVLLTDQRAAILSTDLNDVNTMELVISKLGQVEQVKLSVPPKRMTDMLLLSGAKTWKFTPAMKDGQPVRYRTQFSWQTTR
jgi:hypothetical protein